MHQLPGAQGAPYGLFAGLYYRGHSREDWARAYLQVYPPIDERVPRLGQLPARRHLLPLASDLPEAGDHPASRRDPAGAVARRGGVTAPAPIPPRGRVSLGRHGGLPLRLAHPPVRARFPLCSGGVRGMLQAAPARSGAGAAAPASLPRARDSGSHPESRLPRPPGDCPRQLFFYFFSTFSRKLVTLLGSNAADCCMGAFKIGNAPQRTGMPLCKHSSYYPHPPRRNSRSQAVGLSEPSLPA